MIKVIRANEPGSFPWRLEPDDGNRFRSHEEACTFAHRAAELDRFNTCIQASIGDTWPYGITAFREERGTWCIKDPAQGNVLRLCYRGSTLPVNIYTRDQYERACQACGFEPADDQEIGNYADRRWMLTIGEHDADVVIQHELRQRRLSGIGRESETILQERAEQLVKSGLNLLWYTRDQYERACAIMCVRVLCDADVSTMMIRNEARRAGVVVVDSLPADEVSSELAQRRVAAILAESGEQCGECGTQIMPGFELHATFGHACSMPCYEAMTDRPGRNAG